MRENDADISWQSRPLGTVNQQTRRTRRIQRKAFLFGYSPSQLIWRTWRRMCSRIPLKERTQIRKVMLQKWRHKKTEAQCSCLLPQKPKEIYSANRKEKWLDNSRAQSPQGRTWISEQSPIRCRGTSSRHSVESVSNQNFTGDGEEFTTAYRNRRRSQKSFVRQLIVMWKVLWRNIMESSNSYTSSIRDKRNCRTSCTSNKRSDISRIIAIWIQ